MIFTRDLLYLHVPKTGGMALTRYLLRALRSPVYYSHPSEDPRAGVDGVVEIDGIRHETLAEAAVTLKEYGFQLERLPLILALLRNPYELEVSRFAYLQKNHPWDSGHNQRLAATGDFEVFAIGSFPHAGHARPLESYFLLDGSRPANLNIVRFENIRSELPHVLGNIGLVLDDLPYENKSEHKPYYTYYTAAAEAAVHARYRWVFEAGLYERMDVGLLAQPSKPELPEAGGPYGGQTAR